MVWQVVPDQLLCRHSDVGGHGQLIFYVFQTIGNR